MTATGARFVRFSVAKKKQTIYLATAYSDLNYAYENNNTHTREHINSRIRRPKCIRPFDSNLKNVGTLFKAHQMKSAGHLTFFCPFGCVLRRVGY